MKKYVTIKENKVPQPLFYDIFCGFGKKMYLCILIILFYSF